MAEKLCSAELVKSRWQGAGTNHPAPSQWNSVFVRLAVRCRRMFTAGAALFLLQAAQSPVPVAGFLQPSAFTNRGVAITVSVPQVLSQFGGSPSIAIAGENYRTNIEGLSSIRVERPGSATVSITLVAEGVARETLAPWLDALRLDLGTERATLRLSSQAVLAGSDGSAAGMINRTGANPELRLIMSPVHAAGGDLPLRFYAENQMGAGDCPVWCRNAATGETRLLKTNSAGFVNLARVSPGIWLSLAGQIVRTPNATTVYLASTTFEVTR